MSRGFARGKPDKGVEPMFRPMPANDLEIPLRWHVGSYGGQPC